MNEALKNIISLIQKTNDRCIVTDISGENAYVLMSLAEYEKLISKKTIIQEKIEAEIPNNRQKFSDDLTGDDLLNKINQDIAVWRSVEENTGANSSEEVALLESTSEPQIVKDKVKEIANLPIIRSDENSELAKENDDEKYYFEPVDENINIKD